jgi:hypothetical protein
MKFLRGPSSRRNTRIPEQGQPILTTDTRQLYIGDGSTPGGRWAGGPHDHSLPEHGVIANNSHRHDDTTLDSIDWSKVLNKPDPTVTLSGDIAGSATMTDVTSININTVVKKITTPVNISLSGDVTGIVSFDGSSNVNIVSTVIDDSHNHTNLTGTTSPTYHLDSDSGGPIFKNSTGILELRNSADSDYADLIINNLIVNGTTTTVNSEVVTINDNIVVLNNNYTGSSPIENGGIEVERGTLANASIIWDESNDRWKCGLAGSEIEIIDASTPQTLINKTITGSFVGNTSTASKLQTPVNISLSGDVSGLVSFDGSSSVDIVSTVADNSHRHDNTTLDSIDWSKILNKPDPVITLSGEVSGTGTMTDVGNVTITCSVNQLHVPRTISLSGDVSGSVNFDGSSNVNIVSTVADNSHVHDDTTLNSIDWSKILNKPDPVISLTGGVVGSATMTDMGNVSISCTINSTNTNADMVDGLHATSFLRTDGSSYPTISNVYDIGSATYKFANIYSTYFRGTAITAQYADLAEKYTCKDKVKIGQLVKVTSDPNYDIEMVDSIGCETILGVVSENPGIILNDNCPDGIPVGRIGKVKCLVHGPCKKGEPLTSHFNGLAISSNGLTTKHFAYANDSIDNEEVKLIEIII